MWLLEHWKIWNVLSGFLKVTFGFWDWRGQRKGEIDNIGSIQNSYGFPVIPHGQCWAHRNLAGQCSPLSMAVLVMSEVAFSLMTYTLRSAVLGVALQIPDQTPVFRQLSLNSDNDSILTYYLPKMCQLQNFSYISFSRTFTVLLNSVKSDTSFLPQKWLHQLVTWNPLCLWVSMPRSSLDREVLSESRCYSVGVLCAFGVSFSSLSSCSSSVSYM